MMARIETRTVRPGYMVCLKTSVTGNVSYRKRELEESATYKKWETEKTILEPLEHEAATQLRNKCVTMIRACCNKTSFAYMVPTDQLENLNRVAIEVDGMVREFNRNARYSRVAVYVVTGKLAENDEIVTRAMKNEVAGILRNIESGIQALDPDKVREACKRAKELEDMLSQDAREKLADAVKASRSLARKMGEAGEVAAIKLAQAKEEIDNAKQCFVDLDETEIAIPTVATDTRAVDMLPEDSINGTNDDSVNRVASVDVPSIDF